jgi:uncharacterized membrane protein YfcA
MGAGVDFAEMVLLVGGGLVAGTVNTLAGGGSLLTIPLLVLTGLPGTVANGTNRIGVVFQSGTALWSFRRQGVSELRHAVGVVVPLAVGSLVGAILVSRVSDTWFEKAFGVVMLLLLVPTVFRGASPRATSARPWPRGTRLLVFFAIGVYGGAFQAGIGVLLLLALSRSGFDLVRANAIKVAVVAATAAVAVPVFIVAGQVAWLPAALLSAGLAAGGLFGARLAVHGGERLIRPVVAVAVVALAARMIGLV